MNSQNAQTRLLALLQPIIARPIQAATEQQPTVSIVISEKEGSKLSALPLPPAVLARPYPRGIRELASPLAD
jgi:hypothetical protein